MLFFVEIVMMQLKKNRRDNVLHIHKWKIIPKQCKLICIKCSKTKIIEHDWEIKEERHRKCLNCKKEQWQNPIYMHEGGEVRFYGYTSWRNESFEGRTKPIPINYAYVGGDKIHEGL